MSAPSPTGEEGRREPESFHACLGSGTKVRSTPGPIPTPIPPVPPQLAAAGSAQQTRVLGTHTPESARATVRLARLWQQQGQKEEARQVLDGIYGWFTEGFDTADLKEAKTLLEELSH